MRIRRSGYLIGSVGLVAVVLAGCSSTRVSPASAPPALQPLPNSTVAQSNLPAIGPDGRVITQPGMVNPNLTGTPTTTGPLGDPVVMGTDPTIVTANNDPSFVTLDAVGQVSDVPGRDLSTGLTVEKLLGGWTLISGPTQCRLNLTQTAKTGTTRYRASAPGCALPGIGGVASWELVGSQIQLFDENNDPVASLALSNGNRFVGVGVGGLGLTLVG
jgi:hypothetical protein